MFLSAVVVSSGHAKTFFLSRVANRLPGRRFFQLRERDGVPPRRFSLGLFGLLMVQSHLLCLIPVQSVLIDCVLEALREAGMFSGALGSSPGFSCAFEEGWNDDSLFPHAVSSVQAAQNLPQTFSARPRCARVCLTRLLISFRRWPKEIFSGLLRHKEDSPPFSHLLF